MSGAYNVLDSNNRPISVANSADFTVDAAGYITEAGAQTGRMGITSVDKPASLTQVSPGVFSSNGAVETDPGTGTLIKQGFMENSNVNITRQVSSMIQVVHTYEATAKALMANDDSVSKAIAVLGQF
jgi:flagellar basal-body rod protein FlgG